MLDLTAIVLVSILLLIVAGGIIVLVLDYQKKQLYYLNEKKQLKANFEREILESKLEMQEQTMKNISQELHDNIGQVLSVVRLNINMIDCDQPKLLLQEKINDTSDLVGKVIRDLRNLSKSLDSGYITDTGLINAMADELELLRKTGAYTTKLSIEGKPFRLKDQNELIIFRVFQEVINNIIKHSKASAIDVIMSFNLESFVLKITDNGNGFDTMTFDMNTGLGIRNMINRSKMIGAQYSIDSLLGKGTLVKIDLPLVLS